MLAQGPDNSFRCHMSAIESAVRSNDSAPGFRGLRDRRWNVCVALAMLHSILIPRAQRSAGDSLWPLATSREVVEAVEDLLASSPPPPFPWSPKSWNVPVPPARQSSDLMVACTGRPSLQPDLLRRRPLRGWGCREQGGRCHQRVDRPDSQSAGP